MPSPRKLALALVVVVAIVVAWLAALKPVPEPGLKSSGVGERREVTTPTRSIDDDTRQVARARWEERRAKIRAAHARGAHDDASGSRRSSARDCAESECSPGATDSGGDALFASLIDETMTLTQGCEELLGHRPTAVRIEARLIGAPDIGTIVESLDVSGPVGDVDALTECLTEGMYALELGDAATSFERDAVLMLGLLDEVADKGWLPPERVGEVRQQMIDGGLDPDKDPMTAVSVDEPPSTL